MATEENMDFSWIASVLEQLNALHEKAPLVVNTCILMICATPLVAVSALPLTALRKSQNSEIIAAYNTSLRKNQERNQDV
ncbi:hypothetical protein [Photobacterium satsumensis]|uniref:hypothetical protein n=1 Tax=Photobacterium satsumensis TaxID=2910239 RepID=UPI003D0CB376